MKNAVLLFILLNILHLLTSCIENKQDFNNIYVINVNGKFGIIDNRGKILLPIKYEFIRRISDIYFYVQKDTISFIYNLNKNQYQKTDYENFNLLIMKDSLFAFFRNDSIFIKNKNFYDIFSIKADIIKPFDNKYLIARYKDKFLLYNTNGKQVFKFYIDAIYNFTYQNMFHQLTNYCGTVDPGLYPDTTIQIFFHPEILVVREKEKNDKYYIYNKNGIKLNEHQFDFVFDFTNDLLIVKENGKWGFMDNNFKLVTETVYDEIGNMNAYFYNNKIQGNFLLPLYLHNKVDFNKFIVSKGIGDNFVRVKKNGKWGFINLNNGKIIPFIYQNASNFSNGIAPVKKNNKWYYIDQYNKVINKMMFDSLTSINGEIGFYKINNKWGIINYKGVCLTKNTIKLESDIIQNFAVVSIKHKFGFVTNKGEFTRMEYDSIINFDGKTAWAKLNNKWGLIDVFCNKLTEFVYDNVGKYIYNEDKSLSIYVKKNNLFGIIDKNGKIIIPPIFTSTISWLPNRNFYVAKDSLFGFFDSNLKQITPYKYKKIRFNDKFDNLIEAIDTLGFNYFYDKNLKLIWKQSN